MPDWVYNAMGYLGAFILTVQVCGLLDMWQEKMRHKHARNMNLDVFKTYKHKKKDHDKNDDDKAE